MSTSRIDLIAAACGVRESMELDKLASSKWDETIVRSPFATLTKRDVHDYYRTPDIQEQLLKELRGKDTTVRINYSPDKVVLRRNDSSGQPISIRHGKGDTTDLHDLGWWVHRRTTEFHPNFSRHTGEFVVDIDPGPQVGWDRLKSVTGSLAKGLLKDPRVVDTSVWFSGKEGFYIRGRLDGDMDINKVREHMRAALNPMVGSEKDLTLGVAEPGQIRLDLSPLKYRGSVRAPYSLSGETGLVSAPVSLSRLPAVHKQDFTIERVLRDKPWTKVAFSKEMLDRISVAAYVTGPSGGGKTTYIKKNYPEDKYKVLHTDDYEKDGLGKKFEVDWVKLIADAAAAVRPVVIEGRGLNSELAGLAAVKVVVDPGLEEVLRRRKKRGRDKDDQQDAEGRRLYAVYQRSIEPRAEELGFEKVAAALFAPGIPQSRAIQPIPNIKVPVDWVLAVQEHEARKAGLHWDLRLVDPDTGRAHSFVLPKRRLPDAGENVLAIQQPTHTANYALTYEGHIPEGYGKGNVSFVTREPAEILDSSNDHIRFALYQGRNPAEFLLRRTGDTKWLLRDVTMTPASKGVMSEKFVQQRVRTGEANKYINDTGYVMQPKVDGVGVTVALAPGRIPRVYTSEIKGTQLREHTHKLRDLLAFRVPNDVPPLKLRGELYAVDAAGKSLPVRDVVGMANAGVMRSRELQKEKGPLKLVVFDVTEAAGKDVRDRPYADKLRVLNAAAERVPVLALPPTVRTRESKWEMFENIRKGRLPLTQEGVVFHPLQGGNTLKTKFRTDYDVYVRDVFPAGGAREGKAGGFAFSWTPGGPVVGRVGTGFDMQTLSDMQKNPNNYIGRVARVRSTEVFPREDDPAELGALRAPAFHRWGQEE